MADQQYVSLLENKEHLDRHFSGSLTVGSKFLPEAQDKVAERVEIALMQKFQEAQDNGEGAKRVVMELEFDDMIGTDALIALNEDQKQYQVIRDAGTPGETEVTAVEAQDVPMTNKMTVIAGSYGPTGKWGIYTMFPGEEAPAFPNERQPEDVRAANAEFWQNHGFLATKTEIMAQTFAKNAEMLPKEPASETVPAPEVKNARKVKR